VAYYGTRMTKSHSHLILTIVLFLAALSHTANARPKKAKIACGMKFLPFTEGAQWRFEYTTPDNPPERAGLTLADPKEITIKVIKIERKKGATAITLSESYRKNTLTTELTCTKTELNVSPQSFFASAEIGGGLGMTLENLQRTGGPTFRYRRGNLVQGDSWREDIAADVIRATPKGINVTHDKAKVEVERAVTIQGREPVESGMGVHDRALRVDIQITGRASVQDKSVAMPPAQARLWFVSGVGLVRAENRFGQGWKRMPDPVSAAPTN